jgi:hypothetical protein
MNYKEYIETTLQSYTTDYVIRVYDEVNHNYNPKNNEIVVIIKKLSGSVIGNVKFYPVQFEVYGSNNETNDTMNILTKFVEDYSNTNFMIGLDYYKQDYSTPIDATNFNAIGEGYRSRFIITGTLMITNSISDVDKVYINNREMNNTAVNFSYSTNSIARKTSGDHLQKNIIENGGLLISVTMFKNADVLNEDLSLLKLNKKSLNDTYNLKFIYTDNNREEEYKCNIQSFNENHDRTNPPTRTIVFSLAD